MAISRDKKKVILDGLNETVKGAKSLVFVNFHGLNVSLITEMRKNLRDAGVKYLVAKKTLVKKALDGGSFGGTQPDLPGELAIAWSDDLIAPAREVYNFQKKNVDNLKIVGGIFEGKYMNMGEMMEIATIPGMNVLQGKFVNIINSPIQRFVIGLSKIADTKTA